MEYTWKHGITGTSNHTFKTEHYLKAKQILVDLCTGDKYQLKKERDRVKRELSGLEAALTAFASAYSGTKPSRKRRKMSAKSRAKIAAAQRARWARYRKSAKK
jgi:hypothetical protein